MIFSIELVVIHLPNRHGRFVTGQLGILIIILAWILPSFDMLFPSSFPFLAIIQKDFFVRCNIPIGNDFHYQGRVLFPFQNVFQWTVHQIATLLVFGTELDSGIGWLSIFIGNHGRTVVINGNGMTIRKEKHTRVLVPKVIVVNQTLIATRSIRCCQQQLVISTGRQHWRANYDLVFLQPSPSKGTVSSACNRASIHINVVQTNTILFQPFFGPSLRCCHSSSISMQHSSNISDTIDIGQCRFESEK
mmetsp:Transcript_30550/g.73296  ORF Transcript_30550/g.73296 Transcript_30550/m.73296 type:complete len:247 (-) Transcript_30550:1901-2641(-)